jgi:hypothetical protein
VGKGNTPHLAIGGLACGGDLFLVDAQHHVILDAFQERVVAHHGAENMEFRAHHEGLQLGAGEHRVVHIHFLIHHDFSIPEQAKKAIGKTLGGSITYEPTQKPLQRAFTGVWAEPGDRLGGGL